MYTAVYCQSSREVRFPVLHVCCKHNRARLEMGTHITEHSHTC
jgi:hypothetical protein